MIRWLRKIFGIHSPSRWGMSEKEWELLRKDIIERTDKAMTETVPMHHYIGIDLANGKDFTSPPSFLDKKFHIK